MMNEYAKKQLIKIMLAFPRSYIKFSGEFELILDEKDIFFIGLDFTETKEDLIRKTISSTSRCYKTYPYHNKRRNDEYQKRMMKSLNEVL